MTHNQEKNQTTETNSEMKEMMELGKNIKTYNYAYMFKNEKKYEHKERNGRYKYKRNS